MSGNRVENRDRYRRKDSGRGDDERRDKNRSRQDDRYRNDKRERSPKRRDRSRSRSPQSRHRDDNNMRQNNRQQSRQYNRNDNNRRFKNNHSRKFNFDDKNIKQEASPEWGTSSVKKNEKNENEKEKDKPNFGLSGKLTEDTNTVNGIVIKYSEPQDSRKPKKRWRLYQFKGEKTLPTLHIHRQSAYLMGRDRKIADIPLDHPSCSKQHAALQYRLVPFKRENGSEGKRVRPYIIDLESANGTFVNDVKLEPRRYHELLEQDIIKFGFSSREYVILHDQSKDFELDDDDVTVPSETAVKTEEAA